MTIETPHVGVGADLQDGDQFTYQYEDDTWSDITFYSASNPGDIDETTPVVILYRPQAKTWPTAAAIVVREARDFSGSVPDGTILMRDKDGDYLGLNRAVVRARATDSIDLWDDLIPVSRADSALIAGSKTVSATTARSIVGHMQATAQAWIR